MPKAADVYAGLRDRALHASAAELGLSGDYERTRPFGVVMDWALSQAVATTVAFETGEASLYLSSGGGIIGGGGHENVRRAARAFVAVAAQCLTGLVRAEAIPLPQAGYTRFSILTTEGIFSAEAVTDELGSGKHALSPLFAGGQELIAQLRLVTSQKQ